MNITDAEMETIRRASYSIGDLRLAMTRTQRKAIRKLREKRRPIFFLDCSRRWGKTTFLVLVALMTALTIQKGTIRYCAPTKSHGRVFVMPQMDWACEMLPVHMRPRWVAVDSMWIFPTTGARIILGSCETMKECNKQRGTSCDLALFDESRDVRSEVLKYLHIDVIVPQLMTTAGTIIVGSTPAPSTSHYLSAMRIEAMVEDAIVTNTLDDCDHITAAMKQETIDKVGGIMSPACRRELYCENIPDQTKMVVPEFLDVKDSIVYEMEQPEYLQWYTVADLGFSDLSFGLLAYYDFKRAKIVVWDEVVTHRESGLKWGHKAIAMETRWPDSRKTSHRFADGTAQLLADLGDTEYGPGIPFALPIKDDADASLNGMRMRMGRGQIEIHPRCAVLLAHLEGAIWNDSRTSYARIDGAGHWDGVDALKYACRMIDTTHNPYPNILPGVTDFTHVISDELRDELQRARAALRFS